MKSNVWTAIGAGFGMLALILDSKTALNGAAEGMELCIRVVIPSLLPFFFLSSLLTGALGSLHIPGLQWICRICGVPQGGEGLLVMGFLGGYPVGAQNVAAAYQEKRLPKEQATHLLGFCSNAGPSFLFGIVSAQFAKSHIAWLLWAIHILSALLTGFITSSKTDGRFSPEGAKSTSPVQSLHSSLRVMAYVCGWIILFRVLIDFLKRWVLWLLPMELQVILTGLLELTNGCCQLNLIDHTGLRFIIASAMLSLGGVCVLMQTASVVGSLGIRFYLRGKMIQTFLSVILSFFVQLLFPAGERLILSGAILTVFPVILALFAVILRESEKRCSVLGVNRV